LPIFILYLRKDGITATAAEIGGEFADVPERDLLGLAVRLPPCLTWAPAALPHWSLDT
jgi:hypothetical protein